MVSQKDSCSIGTTIPKSRPQPRGEVLSMKKKRDLIGHYCYVTINSLLQHNKLPPKLNSLTCIMSRSVQG